MEPHQEAKLDRILEVVSELKPQVADTKSDVRYLRSEMKKAEVGLARHDERIGDLSGDVGAIGKKIRIHIDDKDVHGPKEDIWAGATVRWRFIGAVSGAIVGMLALASVIATYAP